MLLTVFVNLSIDMSDKRSFNNIYPREDAGGLSREYVLRIPSVS